MHAKAPEGEGKGGSYVESTGRSSVVDRQRQRESATGNLPKVLVLTGPTAVGKTATSISLAKALNGEIISADSVQVYRGLDIGTAKVTEEEMDGVPHHCIDILDVHDEFSAGMFHGMAERLIEDVLGRGKTPIVCGGTGLYLRWLVQGRPNTPMATPESERAVKRRLMELFVAEGLTTSAETMGTTTETSSSENDNKNEIERKWDVAVELVASLGDEETAERLRVQERMNWYRMHRVLDILMQCPGKTLRELDRQQNEDPKYDFRCFFLVRDRVELYRRIDYRVELMVSQGLLTETYEQLHDFLGVEDDDQMTCASRSIGYRDILKFLWERAQPDGGGPESVGEEDVLMLTKLTQASTRQYSHRQMKWFRSEAGFRWLLVSDEKDAGEKENVEREGSLVRLTNTILEQFHAPRPSTDPDPLKEHRMSRDEERLMRQYSTEMRVLTDGSPALGTAVAELKRLIQSVRSSM